MARHFSRPFQVGRTPSAAIDIEEDDVVPAYRPAGIPDEDDGPDGDNVRDESDADDDEVELLPFGPPINSAQAPLGTIVKAGICVELFNGDFFLVVLLVQVPGRGVHMRGILLQRSHRCEKMLQKKVNEVVMVIKAESFSNTDPKADENLVMMPLSAVLCKRKLILANLPFPQASFRESVHDYYDIDGQCLKLKALETGPLVCRWKWVKFYDRIDRKIKMEAFIRLRQSECDFGTSMLDTLIARQWRGVPQQEVAAPTQQAQPAKLRSLEPTTSGPGKKRTYVDLTTADDDNVEEVEEVRTTVVRKMRCLNAGGLSEQHSRSHNVTTSIKSFFPNSKKRLGERASADTPIQAGHSFRSKSYTYGDICAGAGGMASGATQAKLQVKFLLDNWPDACATLRRNFPNSEVLEMELFDFCMDLARRGCLVDVLHISFPCQAYSPANTRGGQNDDKNRDTGYCVLQLFQICKPRVATFEQTPGILRRENEEHFRALIHQITSVGYSVAWRIINIAEHGNAQGRRRLIIIAAAPGEKLPPFPKPTHGIGRGLEPFTTIWDVMQRLPMRDEPQMHQSTEKKAAAYSPHQPLKGLITCSGGDGDLHPSGKRSFTMRELALLQAFPATHRFYGTKTSMRKQIGNAVPSCFAKALFKSIVQSLQETDREAAAYKPEIIEID